MYPLQQLEHTEMKYIARSPQLSSVDPDIEGFCLDVEGFVFCCERRQRLVDWLEIVPTSYRSTSTMLFTQPPILE